jgi:hypothetical protein
MIFYLLELFILVEKELHFLYLLWGVLELFLDVFLGFRLMGEIYLWVNLADEFIVLNEKKVFCCQQNNEFRGLSEYGNVML